MSLSPSWTKSSAKSALAQIRTSPPKVRSPAFDRLLRPPPETIVAKGPRQIRSGDRSQAVAGIPGEGCHTAWFTYGREVPVGVAGQGLVAKGALAVSGVVGGRGDGVGEERPGEGPADPGPVAGGVVD